MNPSIITLGTFDGVHRGHQAILRQVVRRARALKARSVVLAFGMPPRHAGKSLAEPVLLTTLPEKLQILKALGIQKVEVLVFDRKTASTSPEDFFRDTILGRFHAREMVVGPRVAFGRHRAGRLGLLKRLGQQHGVRIRVVSFVGGTGKTVSSRRIRALLAAGNLSTANTLLGYPYSAEGTVVHGARRGRRLGFPTANLKIDNQKILPPGVFWVKVLGAGKGFPMSNRETRGGIDGLCNVGTRPTFYPKTHERHCEVFLLKRVRTLYGKSLRVVFMRKLRAEKRFASAEALQRQIGRDVTTARSLMQRFSFTN